MVEPVSEFFSKVPSGKIDEEHAIPETIMAGMRDLGLFGLQIAEEYGGLGLSNTAYARMAEEFVIDPSLAVS
jgi:acyl-CoA dehydrogenase family protein 9